MQNQKPNRSKLFWHKTLKQQSQFNGKTKRQTNTTPKGSLEISYFGEKPTKPDYRIDAVVPLKALNDGTNFGNITAGAYIAENLSIGYIPKKKKNLKKLP